MRRIALLLFISFASHAALAQQTPGLERGFSPEKVYQFGDLDSINTFNGNLTIRIPLGPSYPVNGGLSYSLSLVYNSKVWDYEELANRSLAVPIRRSNAGMGWLLSLGRIITPDNPTNTGTAWVYESPDGHDHVFYSKLHDTDPDTAVSPPITGVEYSRDGTYMRRLSKNDGTFDVEFADGTAHTFSADTGDLLKMRDRFGNYASVAFVTNIVATQCAGTPGFVGAWEISDSETSRRNYVCFSNTYPYREPTYPGNVDRVVLTAPPAVEGGATRTATYQFNYAFTRICKGPHTTVLNPPDHFDIPLLTSITQPDGTRFDFTYPSAVPPATCSGSILSSMTVPTGATTTYTYRTYMIPTDRCGVGTWNSDITGVGTRTISGPAIPTAQWIYDSALTTTDALVVCENSQQAPVFRRAPSEQLLTTVTDPAGNVDESYYSVWPIPSFENVYDMSGEIMRDANGNPISGSPNGFSLPEYALPITHLANSDGRLLSRRVYTSAGYVFGSPTRSFFRNYERDVTSCIGQDSFCADANPRVNHDRTLYHDDGNAKADVDSSDFDGLGHYRTISLGGTFAGGNATIVSAFNKRDPDVNPSTGIDSGTFPGSFNPPSSTTPWILNAPASVRHTEAGATAIAQSCFDATTGFLRAQRVLAGSARSSSDLLALFTSDDGNVTTESFFGGDIKANAPDSALCAIAGAPPADFEYKLTHSYTAGIRSTTQHSGVGFLSLNRTIDASSGFVMSGKDTADQSTSYSYDTSFRLFGIQPPNLAPTSFTYFAPSGSGSSFIPARVEVKTVSADSNTTGGGTSGTVERHYVYDALGRLRREKVRMPDNSWSLRETLYDSSGRKSTASEMEKIVNGGGGAELGFTPVHLTTYSGFDPFGRFGSVQSPDGKSTTFQYFGAGSMIRTTNGVATSLNTLSDVPVTETYDRQGRLASVTEKSAPDGSDVTTSYAYDVGGRLSSVSTSTQHRYFTYDLRGFLLSEQHPEKGGNAGNGRVIYGTEDAQGIHPRYDSRGHPTRRVDGPFDLTITYDSAERLRSVSETGVRLLKEFTYEDNNNLGSDLRKGKLITATRFNHLADGREVKVTETYTYAGRGGAASRRDTAVSINGTPFQTFSELLEYDDIGAVARTTYPTCAVACSTPSGGIGTVERRYTNGPLTSVTNYASSLTYNANRTLGSVAHSNGVTDIIAQDDNSIPRPKSITYSGFTGCPAPPAPTITLDSTNLCSGDLSGAAVQAPQSGLAYNWTIEGGVITSATTGTSITFTATTSPSAVLHVTASNACGASPTGSATVTVAAATSISQHPQNTSVPYNTPATLHVVALGTNLAYRWYRGDSGDPSNPETGPTASTPDFTTPALTATTTYWVKVTGQCGSVNSSSATATVQANNLPAPTGLRAATAQGSNNTTVVISWNAVAGASSYRVEYATNVLGTFSPVDPVNPNTTQTNRIHTVPATSSPAAYVYRVKCVDSNGNVSSNVSTYDYAVAGAQLFAIGHSIDEPLRKNLSPVRGADVAELRQAIDALRAAASTAGNPLPPVWSGASPPTGSVTAANLTSLQAPLNAALQVFGWPPFGYSGVPAPAPCVSQPCVGILSEHIQQLRDTLRNALR